MNKEINKHKLRISAYVIDDNYSKPQNAPGRNHDQSLSRLWHFCGRNGEFTFFQRRLQPLYFSRSPPARPTQPSLPFCADVWFSRNSIHAFNKSNIKKRGLWTVYKISILNLLSKYSPPRFELLNAIISGLLNHFRSRDRPGPHAAGMVSRVAESFSNLHKYGCRSCS